MTRAAPLCFGPDKDRMTVRSFCHSLLAPSCPPMWIVRLALNRPYTFVVMALAIVLVAPVTLLRTPTDIFPQIDIPVISLVFSFNGLPPEEMEHRITSGAERGLTTLVNDIEHIESSVAAGHRGHQDLLPAEREPADRDRAGHGHLADDGPADAAGHDAAARGDLLGVHACRCCSSASRATRCRSSRSSTRATTSSGRSWRRCRAPRCRIPYGGKQRLISVDLDPAALQAKGLSPVDVVNAMTKQNLILPSGTTKIGPLEYDGGAERQPADRGRAQRPADQDGRRRDDLRRRRRARPRRLLAADQHRAGRRPARRADERVQVRQRVDARHRLAREGDDRRTRRPRCRAALEIRSLFDQSLFVRAAIQGVHPRGPDRGLPHGGDDPGLPRGAGGARSSSPSRSRCRSSCPSSCSARSDETINIMTLGGLALAVGILVDDATVAIENIDRNLAMGKDVRAGDSRRRRSRSRSRRSSPPSASASSSSRCSSSRASRATCSCRWPKRWCSPCSPPTSSRGRSCRRMALYLLRAGERAGRRPHAPARRCSITTRRASSARSSALRARYRGGAGGRLAHRKAFAAVSWRSASRRRPGRPSLGRDFFPRVDAGQIRLHVRARTGQRIEETARLADQVDARHPRAGRRRRPRRRVLDNIGLPYSGINLSYSNAGTIGTGGRRDPRAAQPDRTTERPTRTSRACARRSPRAVSRRAVLLPARRHRDPDPELRHAGADRRRVHGRPTSAATSRSRQRLAARIQHVPGAVDVHVQQAFDLPTLRLDVDRARAQSVGLSARDVAQNVLLSLSSQLPDGAVLLARPEERRQLPGGRPDAAVPDDFAPGARQRPGRRPPAPRRAPQLLGNLASARPATGPAEVSHYDVQPMIDVYAAVQRPRPRRRSPTTSTAASTPSRPRCRAAAPSCSAARSRR